MTDSPVSDNAPTDTPTMGMDGPAQDNAPMSAAALSYLLFCHSPKDPGVCRVCGSELKFASTGGGQGTKYVCGSPEADILAAGSRDIAAGHSGWGPIWKKASEHYGASEVHISYHGDSDVVGALHELRALRASLGEDMDVPVGENYYPYGHGKGLCWRRYIHVGRDRWEDHNDFQYTHDPSHSDLKVDGYDEDEDDA